ncbi:hypothetical protein GCM10008083_25560 [Ulvibacter litoralis]|nr:hypothetical protein GCM10008083_25560 [Ulvibacter litoralis]
MAQVGIGTTEPTASLDINGNLRIRGISEEMEPEIAKDSILVISRNGLVNRISSKKVLESTLKTTAKANFTTGSPTISLSILSNTATIPFDNVAFDTNNEYNATTYTYTAKQDGIYDIYAQIKASSGISVATNFGLSITKNGTVVAENSYANIELLGVNVTSPMRNVQTLLQLSENDTVTFEITTDLISVDLLNSEKDCFFTIQQIR